MTSSFDVAAELLRQSPHQKMSALKLQKLTFYVFGWYAHVTGSKLFEDEFYAMPKGPVATGLFSQHRGNDFVELADIEPKTSTTVLETVAADVVDTVLSTYGKFNQWQLVEISHEEKVWDDAWKQAQIEGKRSKPMGNEEVVNFFLAKQDAHYRPNRMSEVNLPVLSFLPDPMARVVSEEEIETMENEPQEVPMNVWAQLSSEHKSLLAAL